MIVILFALAIIFFVGGIIFILRATNPPVEEPLVFPCEKENWESIKVSLEQKQEQLSLEKLELENKIKETRAELEHLNPQIQELAREKEGFLKKIEGQEFDLKSSQERICKLQDGQKALEDSLESLKKANEEKIKAGEVNFKKITEINKVLAEQEKILREELIKSRAQVLGLEKICAEFKIQIDTAGQTR